MKTIRLNSKTAIFALMGLIYSALVAPAQTINDEGQVFPTLALPQRAQGRDIAAALGSRLPEVARFYKRSEAELRALCDRSPSLRADRSGRLYYACAGLAVPADAATTSVTAAAAPLPLTLTLNLHSRPGAQRVIYLDFDGNTTKATRWNTDLGVVSIVTPPYDIDGNRATFSAKELTNIQEIWRRISEDYAPFEVDVTTQDPGLEALRKTSAGDQFYGVRVCIGGGSSDWYTGGAGGVAYLNSFEWDSDTPAFVFPKDLGNGNAKDVAEASAHEVGHTFGLDHDGQTNGVEYYAGHGNWAPIMGVGYYKAVVQWSKGEYPLANNPQDDLAIIAKNAPLRADQAGDDVLTATTVTGTFFNVSGIIEQRTDADLFGFTTGPGSITFTVTPDPTSPDLNAQLALYDGSGNLVTTAKPGTNLGSKLTTTVKQGKYFVAVDGVGSGTTTTGFSDYASIGQYSLGGTWVLPVGKPPVAVATSSAPLSGLAPLTVNFSSAGSNDPDGTITRYDWDFGDGGRSSAANPTHIYTRAGVYTASLVVYDNSGLSGSTTVKITVLTKSLHVAGIGLTLFRSNTLGYYARATVSVQDQNNVLVPNAFVAGQWSNLTNGGSSGTTGGTGAVTVQSAYTARSGTFTFTVTGISLSGYGYSPAQNVTTQASVVAP